MIVGESFRNFPDVDPVGYFWALNNFFVPTDWLRPVFLLQHHYAIADLLTLPLILTCLIQGTFTMLLVAKDIVYPNPQQF